MFGAVAKSQTVMNAAFQFVASFDPPVAF